MRDEQLPPAPRDARPARRRWLLAAGLTGLVVTTADTTLADVVAAPAPAPIEILGDRRPDPDIGGLMAHRHGAEDGAAHAAALASTASPATHADAARGKASVPVSRVPEGPTAIARWDGVDLYTNGGSTELVGFHESNNPEALPLQSTRPVAKTHHHSVDVPTTGEADGQVVVLPTRQRPSGAMTAIDLAVEADEPVVSPVDGVVEEVSAYQLYGEPDYKIRIRPSGNPGSEVSIIHINTPTVEVGDRVTAGETRIAVSPRQLAFESQIDRFTDAHRGTRTPHVHIEMRERPDSPEPRGARQAQEARARASSR